MEQFRAFNAAWTLQRVSCCREKGGFVRTLSNQARSAPVLDSGDSVLHVQVFQEDFVASFILTSEEHTVIVSLE